MGGRTPRGASAERTPAGALVEPASAQRISRYPRSRPRHAGPPRAGHVPAPRTAQPAESAPVRPLASPRVPAALAAQSPSVKLATTPPFTGPAHDRHRTSRWWLAVAVVLVGAGAVLGFVKPGFLVTRRLDQAAVQNQVRVVLGQDYRLGNLGAVSCPANLKAVPGRSVVCVAEVDHRQVTVPVRVQDRNGTLRVGAPS